MRQQHLDLKIPFMAAAPRRRSASAWRGPLALIATILWLAISPAVPAFSQVVGGAISGTVRDQTGAVLPGASIFIQNVETGFVRTLIADGAGVYARLLRFPWGNTRLRFPRRAFSPR